MQTKIVYQCDVNGIYIGEEIANQSPLDKELVWLIPAGCVEIAPPEYKDGQFVQWNGKEWEIKEIPPKPEPEKILEPIQPTAEEIEAQRIEDEIQAELRAMAIERIQKRGGTIL